MTLAGRATWRTLSIATLSLSAILVFLYVRLQHFDDREYRAHVSGLRVLKQIDAQSELDVLKLRTGLAADYDVLTGGEERVAKELDAICGRLARESHDEPAALTRRCEALRDILQRKASLIERFKSDHSILRNSLAFLPIAAREAVDSIKARPADAPTPVARRAIDTIEALLLADLLFAQRASPTEASAMTRSLDALDGLVPQLPNAAAERIAIFGAHARTIVREQLVVDDQLNAIAALPSQPAVDDIGNLLLAEQQLAGARSERDRQYLVGLSVVLIALLVYAATRLARSFAVIRQRNDQLLKYGQGLESLVADRVADLRDSEARMAQLARYDGLTGLPNRHLFQERLREAMVRADREGVFMALMFVDLDHFKQINDSLGHAVGDAVLKAVAVRLRDTLRDDDTVARLGGDEFTIICGGFTNAASATHIAMKVRDALASPLVVDGRSFSVSGSIGIALHTQGSDDRDNLLRSADIAMYRAKEGGRNAVAVFAPEMAIEVTKRATMESLLRHALERREFSLVYQPKIDLSSGRICGVEALLRWTSAELGPVSPAEFIPLAEDLGLIVSIGEWVLGAACEQGAAWRRDGLAPLGMAVNLSPRELRDPRLIERIRDVLRDSGFPAECLELELTEGVVMDDIKRNIDTLNAVRRLGVRLAIDDFGTGYSSLAYLSRLPIQTLKIDRALITPMADSASATTLVSTMVTLAHSFGLDVVAEGVETTTQRKLLGTMGCDHVQGFLFSRPIPPDALAVLVRENHAWPEPSSRSRVGEKSLGAVPA